MPLEEAVQLLAFAEDQLLQPDVVSYSTVTWLPWSLFSRTFRTIFLKVDDKAMGAASKHWQMALEIFQALAAGEG